MRRVLRADAAPDQAPTRQEWLWAGAGLAVGALVITVQLARGIGTPDAISQTFDVSFHLNAIEHVVRTGNGSVFGLGDFTGNAYYPLGWHQLGALVVQLTGIGVPSAAHAVNLAVGAVAWTSGCVALAAVVFRGVSWAAAVAGVVAAGFGAFPFRLVEYGVVYPNLLSVALIPGVLALLVVLVRPDGHAVAAAVADGAGTDRPAARAAAGLAGVRWILLVAALGGTALAQPNGTLSILALGLPVVLWALGGRAAANLRAGRRGSAAREVVAALGVVAAVALVWQVVRPPVEDIWWGPTKSMGSAVQKVLLGRPDSWATGWLVALLLLLGLVVLVVQRRRLWIAGPFVVAAFLYVVVASWPDPDVRLWFTGVYFNDAPRVAALVPVGGVLVCTAGAVWLVPVLRGLAERTSLGRRSWAVPAGAGVAALALLVGVAPANANVYLALRMTRHAHAREGNLLTVEERALLEQVAGVTPPDALIAVNPNTGAALAFAISGRAVTEPHIYSTPSDDELFLAANLRWIDEDPRVCEAVRRTGVGYVIDFGTHPVFPGNVPHDYIGYSGLEPGRHLELLLSEGDDAELFRIVGC